MFLVLVFALNMSHVYGDDIYLKDAEGHLHGPYTVTNGAPIRIGSVSATITLPSQNMIAFVQRLRNTVIPEVSFHPYSVREIVDRLRKASSEFAPPGSTQGPINITLDSSPDIAGNPFSQVETRNITLLDALNSLAGWAGLECEIQERGVVLRSSGKPEQPYPSSKTSPWEKRELIGKRFDLVASNRVETFSFTNDGFVTATLGTPECITPPVMYWHFRPDGTLIVEDDSEQFRLQKVAFKRNTVEVLRNGRLATYVVTDCENNGNHDIR